MSLINNPRHSVFDATPTVREFCISDNAKLEAVAKADNHKVILPTHVVIKNGEIVGYISHGAVPTVHMWMDSKKMKARDSVVVLNAAELIARERKHKLMCVPCSEVSPYKDVMGADGFGYVNIGLSNIFVRQL